MPFQFLRTDRRAWLALVLLFFVSLPAVTTRIYASDEAEYFSYLRSLWFDRDVSFENEYRYFYEHGLANAAGFRETFLERRSATGLRENFGTIGCAILWSPFYAAGDVAARALRAAGRPVEADGFSKPYIAAVCYGSAFYGFLALVLSAAAARAALGEAGRRPGEEAIAAAAVWVATPLAFYMYVSPPFSHACSAFAVAAFVFTWLRVRRTWSVGGFVALGALGALMTMVREQDAFFAFGPAVDFLWTLTRRHACRVPFSGCSSVPLPARQPLPWPSCPRPSPTLRSTAASGRRRWCRGRCTGGRRTGCRSCSRRSTACSSGRR